MVRWLDVKNKKKINYRKTIFPKNPTYNNMMYYSSFTKLLLGMIVIILGFIMYHYITFNHHKVKIKTVTSYKDRYIIPENILFLGDSITYRYDLEKYFPNNNVVNSGINSDTIDDILSDMYNRVYKYNPSKIVLLIGTNDMLNEENYEICSGIENIIIQIHNKLPYARIYVESIYPVNNSLDNMIVKDRQNDKILELNKMIKKLCKRIDYTKYIDIYSSLIKDNQLNEKLSDDGLHLNDEGYGIVTKIIDKEIVNDNKKE